ncbi:uncharacterized protein LOC111297781 [Durio zibethinus]|uniref:Uncharacterized protein LOC111297781 n=1 Tax=Durio zibethinus TaxID=66656 RepID=A0A6P5Z6D6_DURZI|nr:uncharacterized protein LOC111297781 [Durio zibethinus]
MWVLLPNSYVIIHIPFLQPENLLLDSYGVLKVLDFGLSAFSEQVRVQAVASNHHLPQFFSGSFDRSIVMKDGGVPSHSGFKWSFTAEVECLAWDPHTDYSSMLLATRSMDEKIWDTLSETTVSRKIWWRILWLLDIAAVVVSKGPCLFQTMKPLLDTLAYKGCLNKLKTNEGGIECISRKPIDIFICERDCGEEHHYLES